MIDTLLKKHASKFIFKEESRPELKGICYNNDGNIYLTDKQVLLIINDGVERENPVVRNPKTGKTINKSYPDVKRMVPDSASFNHEITVDLKEIKKLLGSIQASEGIDMVGDLVEGDGQIYLKVKNDFVGSASILIGRGSIEPIAFRVSNFHKALHFLVDSGEDVAQIKTVGKLSPFSIEAGKYQVLISPVRRY